jgi:hypothetical protein
MSGLPIYQLAFCPWDHGKHRPCRARVGMRSARLPKELKKTFKTLRALAVQVKSAVQIVLL